MPKEDQLPEKMIPEEAVPESDDALPAEPETEESAPEEETEVLPAAKEKTAGLPHPLWRGWWLAVVMLACFVLMGKKPSPGMQWLQQPMRAFAGAIFLGGCLGALPGFLQGYRVDKPSWRKCLLAVLTGLAWGVLA